MSEEPTGVAVQEHPTTWQEVAEHAPGWHPGLQPHVARLLEQNGVTPPSETVQAQDRGEIASGPSRQEITDAFHGAGNTIRKISVDDAFRGRCMDNDIDPDIDMDRLEYWRLFAEYTGEKATAMKRRIEEQALARGEKPAPSLRIRAFELLAAAPEFMFTQHMFANGDMPSTPEAYDHAKDALTDFNGLVRTFARDFPELRASQLQEALVNTTHVTVDNDDLYKHAGEYARSCVRGAQHERGFGQILRAAGRKFRPATALEDKEGADYVDETGSSILYLDVKASLGQIRDKHSNEAFVQGRHGKLIIYSLLRDEEFGDRFFVPEHIAEQRAARLNELLDRAQSTTSVSVGTY